MPKYNKVGFVDEILAGSPTYNISGTGASQTIDLDQSVSQAGTPVNQSNLKTVEDGIEANDFNRRFTTTASSVVTDHIAFTVSQNGLYTALTGEEIVRIKSNQESTTKGGLILDGTDDYGTLPASVGQLTDGSDSFELIVSFESTSFVTAQRLISKHDTTYTTDANPKGWSLYVGSSSAVLRCNASNGASAVFINAAFSPIINTKYWFKVTFNGTTVELLSSTDGISYSSLGTSTDAGLITALTISDIVDTQVGRVWQGSNGFVQYVGGIIYSIELSKVSTPTNEYLFGNFGTNTAILDTIGTDDGLSFNGAIQGIIGALTGTPTLQIDATPAKELNFKGITSIEVDKTYNVKYNSGLDKFDVSASTFEIEIPSNEITPEGGVPLTGASTTISNLDINADGGYYEILIDGLAVDTAFEWLTMSVNGDTTDANYVYDDLWTTAITNTGRRIATTDSPEKHNGKVDLWLNNNIAMAQARLLRSQQTTGGNQSSYAWVKESTTANITSITFAPTAGTFTSGNVRIIKR